MNFWINFWSFFFFLSIFIFAVLAVVVTIGGFFNIKSLFKSLTVEHKKSSSDAKEHLNHQDET